MTDHLRVSRAIALALAAGVTAVAAVAWYIHAFDDTATAAADGFPALFLVWAGTAVTLCAVAIIHWRTRVAPMIDRRDRRDPADPATRNAAILTGAIISWAMVETAALFGVVVYLIEGVLLAGLAGVAIMWAAVAMAWPQPEWFD